jgi:hypothetical protein
VAAGHRHPRTMMEAESAVGQVLRIVLILRDDADG